MNLSKNRGLRKAIMLFLAFAVVLSCLPKEAFAVEWNPGKKVIFVQGDTLKGSDSNSRGNKYFYHSSKLYTNRWPSNDGKHWRTENCYALQTPMHSYIVKPTSGGAGKEAYCVEQNVALPSSGNKKYVGEKWEESPFIGDLYSENVQNGIALALLYGKQPDSKTSDIEKILGVKGANKDDWYTATQTIIWEYQQGLRKTAGGGTKTYGKTSPDFFYSTVKGRKAGEIYKAMLKAMALHEDTPSFTKKILRQVKSSISMELCEDGVYRSVNPAYANKSEEEKETLRQKNDYYVITDTKGLNQNLRVMSNLDESSNSERKKIKFVKKGKNKYTIEATSKPSEWDGKVLRGKKDIPEVNRDDLLAWSCNDGDHYQTLVTGADDPVNFYFKLAIKESPAAGEPEEPQLPSFELDVEKVDKNAGFDGDNHTGMGDAALDASISLYLNGEEIDNKILDVNGYSDEPFYFMPWEDVSELNYEKVEHEADEEKGEAAWTEHIWKATATVKTAETAVPDGRFPEANSERDHGTISYYAHCKDDGPIEYEITYEGGTLTDAADISPDNPQPMVDDKDSNAFTNDNYRGKLQIVKTINDQNPFTTGEDGVKTYSKTSKWTIQLVSGGYEDCPYVRVVKVNPDEAGYDEFANTYRVVRDNSGTPADSNNPLTVSGNGQIKVLDLPYGTYEIKEIQADKNGYVLETFNRTVSEDGQLISVDVNNKAKTNKIKVVKTNSETGKTVRWDADKTAFRIRYKGNPDLADPTEAENYNRYLPNGASYADANKNYVFYANKNGEIVLPYEIEYGIYEIEELVVPEGYYVGSYGEDGKGTVADMGAVDGKGNTVTPPKSFAETVQITDKDGNPVKYEGDNKATYNTYRFSVTEQDAHMEGEDYITYYAVIEMANNPVKGKIEITKSGEGLAGWSVGDIWKAIWDKITLKDTKFEIYSAEDIVQSDGVIPVKAYTADGKAVSLTEVSRDQSNVKNAKAVSKFTLESGESIMQTSFKDIGNLNLTLTEYLVKAQNGATYKDSIIVKDDETKMTYKYTVEYKLNYSKGGYNYTDIHVVKESIADDYVAEIETTEPIMMSGDLEVGFLTMNYDGGNRVTMNPLPGQEESGKAEGVGTYGGYNEDDITAEIVLPKKPEPVIDEETGEQKVDEEGNPVYTVPMEVVRPAGWTDVKDEDGKISDDCYMVEKDGKYQILVKDNGKTRWIPCDKDRNFYKSYKQEYDVTLAQHYNSKDGFTFNWDDVLKLEANLDADKEETTTVITGSEKPEIEESAVYSHVTEGNETTFTGKPMDEAPIYFLTHDGIRTEMFLSGGLTHTKVTVSQSQLFNFNHVLPMVEWFDGDDFVEIEWFDKLTPESDQFEKTINENNYVKATRHEAGKDDKEPYYTIDITSNNANSEKGFRITYPDTTTAVPVVTDKGEGGQLLFTSCDDSMIYPIGSPVETITTNLKGVATSSNLPLGEYWVREVSSTNGHVNKGEWKKFVLGYEDQYTPLVWDTASYENEAVSVKIDLEKLFETEYGSKKYEAGSGAVFGIYTAEEIAAVTDTEKDVDEKIIPADTLVGKMVVEDGHAKATIKLPLGKYYVKEISAPEGYKLNGTKYYFDAVDILTADQMRFAHDDLGITGTVTQNGQNGAVIDFDVLKRNPAVKVVIDDTEYTMDQAAADENVTVSVMDGRTNVQVLIEDGKNAVIEFENGAKMTVSAEGQTYAAELSGKAPTTLETGAEGSENFATLTEDGKTVVKYSPKVTKTNWLSEVTYLYEEPKNTEAGEGGFTAIQPANKVLTLTSPEGTAAVTASIDYAYATAELSLKGTVTSVTVDDKEVAAESYADGIKLERIVTDEKTGDTKIQSAKAIVNFEDGTTFTVSLDRSGQLDMAASGAAEKNLETESTLAVDGKAVTEEALAAMKLIDFKNTTAKTYARNNTSAGVLNITVNKIKNDRLPETPVTPPPTPTPSIKTTALDKETGSHFSYADGKVTLIDEIKYTGLTPGKTYIPKGVLMNPVTKKPYKVNGKEITGTTVFIPETSSGSVYVEFTFDATDFAGFTGVIFEELYLDGEVVCEHKDFDDKEQTIYFPRLQTTASHTGINLIEDVVEYGPVKEGEEFTAVAVLMDPVTKQPVYNNGKKVTSTLNFTADQPNGKVTVPLYFDEEKLAGKTVVVFERIYYKGKLIGSHEDWNDKNQTVKFKEKIGLVEIEPPKGPGPYDDTSITVETITPKTGDTANLLIWIALAVMAFLALFEIYRKIRVKERKE